MNLREALISEHSKALKDEIVKWVGGSKERFEELFHLFLTDEYRIVQRAAWPLSDCVISYPEFIIGKYEVLVNLLKNDQVHNAVKRNITRILQYVEIPEDYCGEVMNCCIDFISSPQEAIAVKAFSLTILQNIANVYPEIIPEIKLIINDRLEYETPAFKSRAKRFLKAFDR